MSSRRYLDSTAHPWPCLLFLLPLVAAYEGGVLVLGEAQRNGADNWLHHALAALGLPFVWLPPLVLLLAFILWSWRRRDDQPGDLVGVLSGMAIESVTYALGLWALSRGLGVLLERMGVEMALPDDTAPALRQAVTFLGAGIYEEALFRLVLFAALAELLRRLDLGTGASTFLAALVSATLFSVAHHLGPYGQPYSNYLFLFRLAAGIYFALLFQLRGFGIAVGSHACYNVMISVG
jgi:membrane protease YdiL (CAAX protease family)